MGVSRNEQGQSILEFVFMLPLLVGITMMLIKINTVIQFSIVNQQYARAQALTLAGNSPIYPRLGLRVTDLENKFYNQMILGVADNAAPSKEDDGSSEDYHPKASNYNISSKKVSGDGGQPGEEPTSRALVRVRNTVTLCTQTNVVQVDGKWQPILPLQAVSETVFKPLEGEQGKYRLFEGVKFDFCRSPLPYVAGETTL
ncbi:hypothetical protein WDW86_01785 [Bdellovibrionota bacterium FG-2]